MPQRLLQKLVADRFRVLLEGNDPVLAGAGGIADDFFNNVVGFLYLAEYHGTDLLRGTNQDRKRRCDHDSAHRSPQHDERGGDLCDVLNLPAFHDQAGDDSAQRQNQTANRGKIGSERRFLIWDFGLGHSS